MPRPALPAAAFAVLLMAAAPVPPETVLHLTETAEVMLHPDRLVASLQVEANAPSAAAAQARVNGLMRDALAAAKPVAAVTASTGAYSVWQPFVAAGKPAAPWHASETLSLSTDGKGAALLALVGTLQQQGLAVEELRFVASSKAVRAAREQATRQALSALRARAEQAAGDLGLHFDRFETVKIDSGPPPAPPPRIFARMAAAPRPQPPIARAQDIPVSASVEADVLLR